MNATIPYNNKQEPEKSFSVKEKIAYTLLSGLAVGVAIHFTVKAVSTSKANKSDKQSFEDGSPATIAKQIKMAFENDGQFGTDTKKLRFIMTKIKSKEQMTKVESEYEKQFHEKLYRTMQKELQSTEYDEMLQIKEGKPAKDGQKITGEVLYRTWAKRLKAAFDKMYSFIPGTDEEAIKTVLMEIPTQRAFVNVGVAYYKEYKANLITDLKSELQGYEYLTYMKIITDKPKA